LAIASWMHSNLDNVIWCEVRWQKLMFSKAVLRPRLDSTSLLPQGLVGGLVAWYARFGIRVARVTVVLPGFSCIFLLFMPLLVPYLRLVDCQYAISRQ